MKSTTVSSCCGWRKAVEGCKSSYSNNVVCQKKSPTTSRAKSKAISEPQDKAKNMQFMDELD